MDAEAEDVLLEQAQDQTQGMDAVEAVVGAALHASGAPTAAVDGCAVAAASHDKSLLGQQQTRPARRDSTQEEDQEQHSARPSGPR